MGRVDSKLHVPQSPQNCGSGVPTYLPSPPVWSQPRARVFKCLWFGQLLKCEKRFKRRVLGVEPRPEGLVAFLLRVLSPRDKVCRHLDIWDPPKEK